MLVLIQILSLPVFDLIVWIDWRQEAPLIESIQENAGNSAKKC